MKDEETEEALERIQDLLEDIAFVLEKILERLPRREHGFAPTVGIKVTPTG